MPRIAHHNSRRLGTCVAWLAAAAVLLGCPSSALAAEEGDGINFGDLGQALVAMATFVLLLVVLGKWVWKPLVKQLQHREEAIAATIANAEKRQKEAEGLLKEYSVRLERAEADARKLMTQARAEAAEDRDKVLSEARQEARKYGEAMKEDIQQAQRDALDELRDMAADVATELAAKVIQRKLTPEDHDRLVADSIEAIRKQASKEA